MNGQGYRPPPPRQSFGHVLGMLVVTCLGLTGIIWLALGWASILFAR